MPTERELIREIEKCSQELVDAAAAAEYWHAKALSSISAECEGTLAHVETEFEESMLRSKTEYDQGLAKLKTELSGLPWPTLCDLGWGSMEWKAHTPNPTASVPRLTHMGELVAKGRYGWMRTSAMVPIIGSQNLLVKARGAGKDRARQALQSIVLHLLATVPPGKLRLTCIDPVGLGATVAGFVKDLPDALTGGQAWFETSHIERQLADLEAHMATVRQKYLGVRYRSIEEYNLEAGEVAEPYRLLVLSDFPSRFSDSAAQRLVSIATNGPDTGVYLLAMIDVDQKMPYNFNMNDLERTAAIVLCDTGGDVWNDPGVDKCQLILEQSPPPDLFEQLVKAVGMAAVDASEVRVPFSRYVPASEQWWQGDSRKELKAAVGRVGAEELQVFGFDEQLASSALAIGRPGSGKSTLLHILITSLAMRYSPDELELYLLDLKQVEFEDYATFGLPHARVIGIQSEREFGVSVLRGLSQELQRRSDLFRERGFENLSLYRTRTGQEMPRILLVIDEFQELFSEDDAIATEATQILDRLIRLGRAFGINALLASQTLAGPYSLLRATKDQIPVRIALQCSDADSRLILSDENDRARLLERPGEAIYNSKNGQIEGNSLFQVFWMMPDEREGYVRALKDKAVRSGWSPPSSQIVFRGNAPARIESNSQLMELLNSERWPSLQRANPAWLGEPVELRGHTAAVFRRQSCSNLVIIGQNQYESSAVSMLLSGLIGLAAQHRPDAARFVVLNMTDVDSQWHSLLNEFAEAVPHAVRVADRREAVATIEEIAGELNTRLASSENLRSPGIFLALCGLHRARDLRLDESNRYRKDREQKTPAELLAAVCQEGPDVGIQTLLWCDTYANLERVLDHNPVRDFDMRVALQMNADDSRRLIDSELASKIGPYRAVYCDEDNPGRLEKFRPYDLVTSEQLATWGIRLRGRA